ncbi:MAG: valine--tRNA ligase, partial [Bacteroidales bacterium]|nr:valine--tRNA ligase [Bacteroidales bacterium]
MTISTKYNPQAIEDKWTNQWLSQKIFHSEPDDRPAYSIVIPPPNVTGVLHMGHMLNNTIQDVLARYHRMLGENVCWVPGTDHASIATEAKVVNYLKEKGIDKNKLTRDEFLKYAWEWKEKHGGIILEQLKTLGASCDWDRTKFTMDPDLSESVIRVFIDLQKKGKIYPGTRMVNWDCKAQTTISDEEVIHKEVQGKLYYVKYQIDGTNDFLTIATTRPETILGDTAICVHPDDERYSHLKGKSAIVPIVNRKVPIIFDEYVDREFGTGALKVTPAHDINDYNLHLKYKSHYPNFNFIDIFNDDCTLRDITGKEFSGKDRFVAQKLVTKKLEELGVLVKVEDYTHSVGFSERTDVVIEPKFSQQWFLRMDELAKPALENVMNDTIQFHPAKFKNTYRHWMENIHDWCISRQLWWGHRIPAYYVQGNPTLGTYVAETKEEALKEANKEKKEKITLPGEPFSPYKESDLVQDEDVLDTWFSSWLWPISVFDGINHPENPDIKYYYPTNDLVTAPEILFFWVARMVMAGYKYRDEKPFRNVYFTGIVRDKQHRKMSKSLGNSPDPIELMKQYGADGVRVGMLLCSPAGNDLLFDEGLVEQGRNFSNKIWNAFRLVKSWEINDTLSQPENSKQAVLWFSEQLKESTAQIKKGIENYKLSEALMTNYTLFWDDFASWYLETVKPAYGQPIDKTTYEQTIGFFNTLLKLLHPFIPFITEELFHELNKVPKSESISFQQFPKDIDFDKTVINKFSDIKEIVSQVRNIRQKNQISPKEKLSLSVLNKIFPKNFIQVLEKLGNLSEISFPETKPENATAFMVGATGCFVPLNKTINVAAEQEKLEEELKYNKGFLNTVMKKLNNENFVKNAP